MRGTVEACFLCNTGRLKLKGAKLKNECIICVRERSKSEKMEELKIEEERESV